MTESSRKFYYLFPHVGLPLIFFHKTSDLYNKLSGSSADGEATRLWKSLAKEFGLSLNDRLECRKFSLPANRELIAIRLPDPKEPPEPYFLGLVFTVKKGFLSREVSPHRYFTLELGESVFQRSFFFCEWGSAKQHKNHGQIEDCSLEAFVQVVRTSLS